jgi:hypothetical protein
MLTGLASMAAEGDTDWIGPHAKPGGDGGIADDGRSRYVWRDLLEHFEPFRASVIVVGEASGVATRVCQAVDEARADRINDDHEHDGHGAGDLLQRPSRRAAGGEDDLRLEGGKFGRIAACDLVIAAGPAVLDLDILPDSPAQLLQPLKKRRIAPLRDGIVCCERHEHADAPHARALLPVRRERPSDGRAAERGQEFSSFDVACHVTLRLGSFMQWRMIPRFHRAVCD